MRNFFSRGSMGDIIYSLPTIISYGGGNLYLRKNNHYEALHTLLESQRYINECRLEQSGDKIDVNLDNFRPESKRNPSKHLAQCHLDANQRQYDLSKPWLQNIEAIHKADIIINRTPRYLDNDLDWDVLKTHTDHCLFVGFAKDYKHFKSTVGLDIPHYQCKDALEFAQIIKGSKLYIGNQSMGFALAEAMKHPRVLQHYSVLDNCRPHSDNGYTQLTEDVINNFLGVK